MNLLHNILKFITLLIALLVCHLPAAHDMKSKRLQVWCIYKTEKLESFLQVEGVAFSPGMS